MSALDRKPNQMDLQDFDEKSQASWRARLMTSKRKRGAWHRKVSPPQVSPSCRGRKPRESTRVGMNSDKRRNAPKRLPRNQDPGNTSFDSVTSEATSCGVVLRPRHSFPETATSMQVAMPGPNQQGSTPDKQGYSEGVAVEVDSKMGADSQVIDLTGNESSQGMDNNCISSCSSVSSPDHQNRTDSLSNFSVNKEKLCLSCASESSRVISQSEASSSTSLVSPIHSDSVDEAATAHVQLTLLTGATEFDSMKIPYRNKQASLFSFLPKQQTTTEQSARCTLPGTQRQSSTETSPQAGELCGGTQNTPRAPTRYEPCLNSDTKASHSRGTAWARSKYPCPYYKRVPGIVCSAGVNLYHLVVLLAWNLHL